MAYSKRCLVTGAAGFIGSALARLLLRETDAACIEKGHRLCEQICAQTGAFIWCDCFPSGVVDEAALAGQYEHLMPLGLYMRPGWLDR